MSSYNFLWPVLYKSDVYRYHAEAEVLNVFFKQFISFISSFITFSKLLQPRFQKKTHIELIPTSIVKHSKAQSSQAKLSHTQ